MIRRSATSMLITLLALVCALSFVGLGDVRDALPQGIAILLVWGFAVGCLPRPEGTPGRVFGAAMAVRLILLLSPICLSDDVYRYLWEGYVAVHGGNPYLAAPADPMWAGWGAADIRAMVNHSDVSAAYPPVVLWLFGALGAIHLGPLVMKFVMGLADAGIAWTLARVLRRRGRSISGAWLYALHPLGAVESAGSGHFDVLALLCLVLAVDAWDRRSSGVGWAALGGLIKVFPVLLIPALWRRSPWLLGIALLLGVVAAWPFFDGVTAMWAGWEAYTLRWSFNAAFFPLFALTFGSWARPIAIIVGACVVIWALRRFRDPVRIALWAGGAFILLSPTVHPWYIGWVWVPALICGVRSWTVLATLVPLSYAALASYDPMSSTWVEPWWPPMVEYLALMVALCWEFTRHLTQPGPWAPGRPATTSRSPSQMRPEPSTSPPR